MKKFVIEYETGSYDTIYTMEAEFETDIKLWILAAIDKWKLVLTAHWELSKDPLRSTNYPEWLKKYEKFLSENHVPYLNVNGYLFNAPDHISKDIDHLEMFTITELDKWVESNKPTKVVKND